MRSSERATRSLSWSIVGSVRGIGEIVVSARNAPSGMPTACSRGSGSPALLRTRPVWGSTSHEREVLPGERQQRAVLVDRSADGRKKPAQGSAPGGLRADQREKKAPGGQHEEP